MISTLIEDYITKKYGCWRDYASYHCEMAGIPDESLDVLNEVLCNLLQKDSDKLEQLFNAKKNGNTELDFFVLRMIKLNVTSSTSPYQNKYKQFALIDQDVDFSRLEIEDLKEEYVDNNEVILNHFHQVRNAIELLDLAPLAKKVFEYRFFQDGNFADWRGEETPKQLYKVYNTVLSLVKKKIDGDTLF